QNGTSYTAELTDFEFKRIAAKTSSSIDIRFKDKNDSMIKKQMSIPVEMAGDIQKIRVVPIRYEPDNFEEVVLLAAYKTQKSQVRSEEHTSELQSRFDIVCRLLLE